MTRFQLLAANCSKKGWRYAILDTLDEHIEIVDEKKMTSLLERGIKIDGVKKDGTPFKTHPLPCERVALNLNERTYAIYGVNIIAGERDTSFKYEAFTLNRGIKVQTICRTTCCCTLLVGTLEVHTINKYSDTNKTAKLKVTQDGVTFTITYGDCFIMSFDDKVGSYLNGPTLLEYICSIGGSPCEIRNTLAK